MGRQHRNVETGFIVEPAGTAFGSDPLQKLLAEEGSFDEVDITESNYFAGTHRCATFEREREGNDLLGASPFEIWMAHRERYDEQ